MAVLPTSQQGVGAADALRYLVAAKTRSIEVRKLKGVVKVRALRLLRFGFVASFRIHFGPDAEAEQVLADGGCVAGYQTECDRSYDDSDLDREAED